jgi:hypothetical protein
LRPDRAHRGRRRGPGPRRRSGQPASLAAALRGGWSRGAAPAATGPGESEPAGLGRAGRHRGAPLDLLEQQAPRRGVHTSGHLPVEPPRGGCPPRRAGHGTALGAAGAGSSLRTGPARRALAHRHQGSLLPAACQGRVHEGLDRRARRRPFPLPHRPARPAPAPDRAHPWPGCATASNWWASRSRS